MTAPNYESSPFSLDSVGEYIRAELAEQDLLLSGLHRNGSGRWLWVTQDTFYDGGVHRIVSDESPLEQRSFESEDLARWANRREGKNPVLVYGTEVLRVLEVIPQGSLLRVAMEGDRTASFAASKIHELFEALLPQDMFLPPSEGNYLFTTRGF